MNVYHLTTAVVQTLFAPTRMDLTSALVIVDIVEMDLTAKVCLNSSK